MTLSFRWDGESGSASEPEVWDIMPYSIGQENGHILRDFLMAVFLPVTALIVSFLVLLFIIKRRITRPLK